MLDKLKGKLRDVFNAAGVYAANLPTEPVAATAKVAHDIATSRNNKNDGPK